MRRILIIASLCCSQIAAGQFSGSASFMVGTPQGDFAANVSNYGYGLGVTVGYAPEAVPLGAGLKLGFLTYGSENRDEPFSPTIPDVNVEVSTDNNIFILNLEGRIQPNTGVFRPFINGTFGASILSTRTTIKNESTGEEVASSSNKDDAAFNYGVGGGLDVRVWQQPLEEFEDTKLRLLDISVHVGFTYLKGGEAEYLRKGSIQRVNGKVVYDVLRSRTDIVLYTIGVSASF